MTWFAKHNFLELLHFRPTLPPPPFPGHWSGSDAPRVAPATAPVQTFKFTPVQLVPLGTFSLQSEDQVVLKIIPTLQKSVICLGKILNHIKWRRWLDKVFQLLFPFQLWFVCQHWKQLLPSKNLKSFTVLIPVLLWNAEMPSWEVLAKTYWLKTWPFDSRPESKSV